MKRQSLLQTSSLLTECNFYVVGQPFRSCLRQHTSHILPSYTRECVRVCEQVCIPAHACVFACTWSPEDDLGHLQKRSSPPLRQGLLFAWSSSIRLHWVVSKPRGLPFCASSAFRLQACSTTLSVLSGCWGLSSC